MRSKTRCSSIEDVKDPKVLQEALIRRLATRRFLQESCELARCLPSAKKCLFVMRYSNGFSIEEIARLCKVSTGTVSNRLKQITRDLQEMRKSCEEIRNAK